MNETQEIQRICAWCDKVLGTKEVRTGDDSPTHGICLECYDKFIGGMKDVKSNSNS